MVKRFFKGKPYSLMLVRQDENGDPFTWINLCTTQMVTQTIVVTVQILYRDGSSKREV